MKNNSAKRLEAYYQASARSPALKRHARIKQSLLTRVPDNENVSSRHLQAAELISIKGKTNNSSLSARAKNLQLSANNENRFSQKRNTVNPTNSTPYSSAAPTPRIVRNSIK